MITAETTVGEIVRARPAYSRVFESLKIDYCCGGKKPLGEVCRSKGLDVATVLAMLTAFEGAPDANQVNPDAMSLSELCDHIQETHHKYLRDELPRLDFMTRKVLSVHGDGEPRLQRLREVFESFNTEMLAHTSEEDDVVFPAIRRLESGGPVDAAFPSALEKLEREHEGAGAALEEFRSLTDDYTPPEWACNTFRAMYNGLADLERNMHQHVSKENSILFPKALAAANAALAPSEARGAR